jgi:hypothetical protein
VKSTSKRPRRDSPPTIKVKQEKPSSSSQVRYCLFLLLF